MIRGFGLSSTATNYKDALQEVRKWLDMQEGVPTPAIKVEGRKTTVTLPDGRVGVSRCCPEDTFDIITGVRVALDDIERKSHKLSDNEKMLLNTAMMMGAGRICVEDDNVCFDTDKGINVMCCDRNDMFKFLSPCEEYSIATILSERS